MISFSRNGYISKPGSGEAALSLNALSLQAGTGMQASGIEQLRGVRADLGVQSPSFVEEEAAVLRDCLLALKQVMERVLTYAMRKRWLVPLPFWAAKVQAAFLQLLPNPPLTIDQVRLLEADNVVSEEAKRNSRTLEALGIEPVAIAAVVPGYLERFRPRGQFSNYRP